jgi:hypothetical protein
MFRAAPLLLGAVLLAGCQTAGRPSPERPGTALDLRNPDPAKWAGRSLPHLHASVWSCRPLACADGAVVVIQTTRAPTRDPDPRALQKLAKILPAQTQAHNAVLEIASDGNESIQTLSSRVTKLKGYPAILTETKRLGRGKPTYTITGHIFVGMIHAKLISQSVEHADAKRHFDDFLAVMAVEDYAPGAAQAASAMDGGSSGPPAPQASASAPGARG